MIMAKNNAKTAKPKRRSKPGKSTFLKPEPGGVAVRCYRHGLGDCFLLAFAGKKDKDKVCYVLIDCGVHARQIDGPKRLAQVMEDVRRATGGSLDVVVATHEHADHLSGFVQKGSPFLDGSLDVKQLWVAWTEKRGDKQADALRKKRGAARAAIEKAIEKLQTRNLVAAERVQELADFEEMPGEIGLAMGPAAAAAGGKKPSSNEVALAWLKKEEEKVRYCEPGEMLGLEGVKGVRAYVLGPPRDDAYLKRDLPSGGKRKDGNNEVYLAGSPSLAGLRLALDPSAAMGEDGRVVPDHLRNPFDKRVRRPCSPAGPSAALPPGAFQFFSTRYFAVGEAWRKIDDDWLAAADQLALNLDSDTNNTSLVLAFEWGPPGKGHVLLFTGDAQVGNWLSWRQQTYRSARVTVTADDLLGRTIFYKVGHHGSHNATMKRDTDDRSPQHPLGAPYGLELMPSHLLAYIPVDRKAVEKNMPTPWAMPYPPMYETLLRKTSGRVLRADGLPPDEIPEGQSLPSAFPKGDVPTAVPGFARARWREAAEEFTDGRQCPLYYDVFFDSPS
jgi:hypothetical protein